MGAENPLMYTKGMQPQSWRKNLIIITIAEFLAVAGFTLVNPIAPLYLQELGNFDNQQAAFWTGICYWGLGYRDVLQRTPVGNSVRPFWPKADGAAFFVRGSGGSGAVDYLCECMGFRGVPDRAGYFCRDHFSGDSSGSHHYSAR